MFLTVVRRQSWILCPETAAFLDCWCHGHDYQHAANEEIAGICCRIGAILELKKEEEITRVCAGNNTLGIIKVREQKYVAALESTRKLAVTSGSF